MNDKNLFNRAFQQVSGEIDRMHEAVTGSSHQYDEKRYSLMHEMLMLIHDRLSYTEHNCLEHPRYSGIPDWSPIHSAFALIVGLSELWNCQSETAYYDSLAATLQLLDNRCEVFPVEETPTQAMLRGKVEDIRKLIEQEVADLQLSLKREASSDQYLTTQFIGSLQRIDTMLELAVEDGQFRSVLDAKLMLTTTYELVDGLRRVVHPLRHHTFYGATLRSIVAMVETI